MVAIQPFRLTSDEVPPSIEACSSIGISRLGENSDSTRSEKNKPASITTEADILGLE